MNVLVLGLYDNGEDDEARIQNIPTATYVEQNMKVNELLSIHVQLLGPCKFKKVKVVQKVLPDYPIAVVVGLGSYTAAYNEQEELEEKKDNIRRAIAAAVTTVRSLDIKNLNEIHLDSCGDAEQVAIGAVLSDWTFDELKSESLKRKPVKYVLANQLNPIDMEEFQRGLNIANLQNVSRRLQELPANILTPTRFANEAQQLCEPLGIKVIVHDRKWAEEKKMFSFLSVTNGSEQPCKFVELHYMNAGEKRPSVLVGKGITFDSGGISLKPASRASLMDLMRADMGGAATVLSSIAYLAKLKSKVNGIGLIPLTENIISGKATRPGDVVYAMNGKSIQIDNTDAEGRLILADALCYADTFDPEVVVDIAPLTGACKMALGNVAAAVMTTSSKHWELIRECGHETGDRVWRLPLFSDYATLVKNPPLADLFNMSKEPSNGAGTIVAGKFLQEFTKSKNWIHVDIANVKYVNSSHVLGKGMTGIPMRTMVRFIQKVFA